MTTSYEEKWVLITGASAGIGAEFAHAYAKRHNNIVLVARREDRLNEIANELSDKYGVKTHVIVADLAEHNAPKTIFNNTTNNQIDVAILINNAGFGFKDSFIDVEWQKFADGIQVMLTATTHLTHLYLPKMRQNKFGRIINNASIAGFLSGYMDKTFYFGIKKAVIEFSKMLHQQVANDGVFVSALCPGFTRSEFHHAADMVGMRSSIPDFMWMDAKEVVTEALAKNEKNKAVIVPGVINKLLHFGIQLTPEVLFKLRG